MADSGILSTLQKHNQRLDALENELAAVKAKLATRPDPQPARAPDPKRTKERRPAASAKPTPPAARPDPPAAPKRKPFFDEF